jgi:hypothetical protein
MRFQPHFPARISFAALMLATALAQPVARAGGGAALQTATASASAQKMTSRGSAAVPLVAFVPPNITFSTQVVGVSSPTQPLTLQNVGTATLDIANIGATGDFSQTNNCGSTVVAGGSCTITVTFTPQAVWTRTGTIVVNDNAGFGTQTVILSGMGFSGGVASLNASKLAFGSELVGQSSSPQSVTLTNTGSGAITLNAISASGDFSQTNNCGATLNAGANCNINVTFTPSWAGSRNGEIVLNLFDPPAIEGINLSGTGTAPNTPVSIAPQTASLTPTQTVTFQASVNGKQTNDVTWSVDGIVGGNSSVGVISPGGVYTPPGSAGSHTIEAVDNQSQQSASVPLFVTTYAGTFTQHNDNARTGQNLNETALSPANVNPTEFGKLFSQPVDGFVYAQPLYAAGVNIPGQGLHNVVYVATEHDSVYAFDADVSAAPLWKDSFISLPNVTTVPSTDYAGHYTDMVPEIGISGTPVIDPAASAMYVVVKTKELVNGKYVYLQRLHALDITTGAELPKSPVVIQASVKGHGLGNDGHDHVPFNPFLENQRPGLLLLNGVVYVSFGSHGDQSPFHGWMIGYQVGTLQQVAVRNTTPNSGSGGIWQGGGGPAADTKGNIFVQTSNGGFDGSAGGFDYGDTFLRMGAAGKLRTLDYFTPFNQQYLRTHNLDVGSGGSLILPDQPGPFPHLLVGGGKTGRVYLLNRDAMGGYSPTADHVVQEVVSAFSTKLSEWGLRGLPAYWQNHVYFAAVGDVVKDFPLSLGLLSAFPLAQSMSASAYPGATTAISANAQTNGLVWLLETDHYAKSGPAFLRAYDATDVGYELYNTNMNAARDTPGPAVKFTVPTVANAKVYVGTQTELDVYGLLP